MIRVLAICQEDPEWILGGMGRHVRELYRAMTVRDDVTIDLLVSGPHEGPKLYLGYTKHHNDKLTCYKPRFPGMSSLLTMDVLMLKTLLQLVAEGHRWDVIHCHEWNSVQVAWAARDALKLPLVGTMHLCITALSQMEEECPTDSRKVDSLLARIPLLSRFVKQHEFTEDYIYLMQQEGHLIVGSDELILCSHAYVQMARRLFMTDRRVHMIYNGIDVDDWNPRAGNAARARLKHGLPQRDIALYVGRIADMKGIRPLLDAVESRDTGYCVVLCGEVNANNDEAKEAWPVTKRIRKLEKQYPERLRWIGFHFDQDIKDLYCAANVGLMPSIHEPFGIVALEMMAMGLPLISTEVDGLGEIVVGDRPDGYTLIIRPRAEDIIEALDVMKCVATRNQIRNLGLRRVRDFTWDKAAEQTVDVYRRAVENKDVYRPQRPIAVNDA